MGGGGKEGSYFLTMRLTTKDKHLTYTPCQISFKPTPHCVGALEASLVLWAPPLRLALPYRSALTVPAPRHLQSGPPFFRILSVFQFEGHSALPSPPSSRPTFLSRSQQVLLILRLPRSTLSGGVRPTTDFHLLSTHHPNIGSAYILTP